MPSVCEISENRQAFSGRDVATEGWLTALKRKRAIVSRRHYVVAQLRDTQGQCFVRIFDRGHDFFGIDPAEVPLRVTVTARYYRRFFSFAHELHPYDVERQV